MKPKELTKREFDALIRDAEGKAQKLAIQHNVGHCPSWWISSNEVVLSQPNVPCIYETGYNQPAAYCPVTGKVKPKRPLPKGFRDSIKIGVRRLQHFSTAFCASMNLKMVVDCFAVVNGKYYHCQHKIGKCPWKEAPK